MQYLVVVEEGPSSFGAHVPDLPGCIAAGESKDEVLNLIRQAIDFHIEGLKENGEPIPPPHRSPKSSRSKPHNSCAHRNRVRWKRLEVNSQTRE